MKLLSILIGMMLFVPLASAIDIAYVLKNPSSPNPQFVESMNELDYTYDLIDDSEVSLTDFSKYRMILIGDENIGGVPVNDYKSLIANPDYYVGWSFIVISTGSNQPLKANNTRTNSITQGIEGVFQVYTQATDNGIAIPMHYLYGRKYNSSRITSTIDNLGEFVVATKDEPRRVFFGITKSEFWTEKSKQLFKNSITWVMKGEDIDKDGFFDDDCDENDPEINPNATEIAYDGVDQNCDGFDLTDVDEDGYDALIIGGDDCDDEDETINPGAEDVYKNCVNDAPIVEEISDMIFYETDIVEIVVDAVDPEEDSLTYSINDTRFEQDGNVFIWQTGYYDYGNYFFTIDVSDGILKSSVGVKVTIRGTNQEPVCDAIPVFEWNEDEWKNAILDLSQYCFDPDEDDLFFLFNSTSPDTDIILENLDPENGIASFSSAPNWSGQDWIVFKITDLKSEIFTNEIILKVNPVNDAPTFNTNIENIEWNEDSDLIEHINLNDYFFDIDSDLDFNVSGNNHIQITIENGLISFYPEKNWWGTEAAVFEASDGEFTIYSNEVELKVLDRNEPPEFGEINCDLEIDEDVGYSCELNASDFEVDEFNFKIVEEDNLNCKINENILEYISDLNYNGPGSCLIKVSDDYDYNEYLLEVNVIAVNDAPIIKSYSPGNNPKIMENTNQLFNVVASDVDSDVSVSWLLDNVIIGSGNNYLFNKEKGAYEVRVEVTDGLLDASHSWNVFVGDISDFTCSEVGGYIMESNEICPGELLGVSDSNSCCSIAGSPKFDDINRCKVKNDTIKLKIRKPNEGDEFNLGEKIEARLEIENNFKKKLNFDVEAYLYDISEDKEVKDYTDSIKIDEGKNEKIDIEFEIPYDLDVSDEYALFFKVIEEDEGYCNEDYLKIEIVKEDEKVIIEDLLIISQEVFPGGYLEAEVEVENIGNKDQEDVYVLLENSKLGISEKSELFDIDEDNTEKILFNLEIPEDAEEGEYNLKAKVVFEEGDYSASETFSVLAKKIFTQIETNQEPLLLNSVNGKVKEDASNQIGYFILAMIFMMSIGTAIVLIITRSKTV